MWLGRAKKRVARLGGAEAGRGRGRPGGVWLASASVRGRFGTDDAGARRKKKMVLGSHKWATRTGGGPTPAFRHTSSVAPWAHN